VGSRAGFSGFIDWGWWALGIYISGFVLLLRFFKGPNGDGVFPILPLFEVWSSVHPGTQASLPKQFHQLLTDTQSHLSRPLSLARFKSDSTRCLEAARRVQVRKPSAAGSIRRNP
jgi:hypothetical protein